MSQEVAARPKGSLKIFVLLGAGFLVLFVGMAGWKVFARYQHSRDWQAVVADVVWSGEKCQMAQKSGKSWSNAAVVDCVDVEAFEAQNASVDWRSTPTDFVTLGYDAAGSRQEQLIQMAAISTVPLASGAKAAIFVDPDMPTNIDRAVASEDYLEFAILAAAGLALMVVTILLGHFILRANARMRQKKLTAAGTL